MFQLYKPSWLHNFLAQCNWTILTWYIDPGYYIENTIDWAIYYINSALEWGQTAYNWATVTWDRLTQEASELWKHINNLWVSLSQLTQNIWTTLTSHGQTLLSITGSWLFQAIHTAYDFAAEVSKIVFQWFTINLPLIIASLDITGLIRSFLDRVLGIDWLGIWQSVLDFFTSGIPDFIRNLPQWLNQWLAGFSFVTALHVTDIVNNLLAPFMEVKEWWDGFSEDVKAFFANPINWLLKKWSWDTVYDFLTPFVEAAGGTEAERDEEYAKVPSLEDDVTAQALIFKDETQIAAQPQAGIIEEEIARIRALLLKEIA